tara:strand:- start:6146 stop:6631 length:486 start_codon:yes stop_codon:yes gene_type:complete
MKLSKNFTLEELIKSNTAKRLGIENKPNKEGIIKLRILATALLQPLRERLGVLRVSSGFRSKELNKIITGHNKGSQHCECEAVDLIYVKRGKIDNIMIFQTLIDLNLDFDQCILEYGDGTKECDPIFPDWVHLSYKITGNRKQVLVAYKDKNNKTKYRFKN